LESKSGTVEINVIRQNRAPNAEGQTLTVVTGTVMAVPLRLSDQDNDPLQTIILKGPAKGLLYGIGTNLFYAPKQGTLGEDQFTYKGWDGQKFGNVGTVTVFIDEPPKPGPPQVDALDIVEGIIKIHVVLSTEIPFQVQASTNLTNWYSVSDRLVPQGSAYVLTDTNAPTGVRFYRAINVE